MKHLLNETSVERNAKFHPCLYVISPHTNGSMTGIDESGTCSVEEAPCAPDGITFLESVVHNFDVDNKTMNLS